MKHVDKIDLVQFLKPESDNIIKINFNAKYFLSYAPGVTDFSHFEGKWLFFDIDETKEMLYCPVNNYTYGDSKFDLQMFYEKLMQLYQKWQIHYPHLQFPNVTICSSSSLKGSACLIFDPETNVHTIYLTLEDLESLERFQYVLGHELGHIVHESDYAQQFHKQLSSSRWSKLFPWEFFTFSSISIFLGLFSLIQVPLGGIVFYFSLAQVLFWGMLLSLTLLSFPRLKNYQTEFFCDHFSFSFAGAVPLVKLGLIDSRLNSYTHPSGMWRKHVLGKFQPSGLNSWESPVFRYSFFFRNANMYELCFVVMLIAYKLKLIKKFY